MLDLSNGFDFEGSTVAWGSIGSGDPIVLIHGFPWSAQCWRNIAPWLARTHQVFYFDMLGTGQSEQRSDQNVSEATQSRLLAALVDHWGIKAPQVVGHDFGGLCALRGHFIHGIGYRRLHLINAVGVLPSGSPFYAHVHKHQDAFAGLPDYAHKALFDAYVSAAAARPFAEDALTLYRRPWEGDVGRPAFYRQIAQADNGNIAEAQARYHKPDFPVHVSWGMKDTFIPPDQGRELAELIGADSFTEIADAAHMVMEDNPAAVLGTCMQNI